MPDDKQFVHLHVHTEFSLLDGLSPIKKIVKRAAEANMSALAITDHGTMFGVIDFYRAAKAANIKPIIGMEAYMAPRGMTDRDPQYDTKPYHLLLLAQNQAGYQNLLKIASAAQLEGYYYRPRVDHDFLAQHAEGLIATSGCLAAEIPRMVEQGREDEALRQIGWYRDVFGPENFYLELQHHDIEILHILNRWLIEKQDYANIPLLATNDVHYVLAGDYDAHDTLLCIQTGNVKNEQNRLKMTDPSYHLRTPEEMWRLFAHVPEALTNSLKIAEMCDVNLDYKGYHLPVFPVPDGFTAETYLRYLCEQGIEWRYGSHANDPDVRARLEYELNVIHDMGFDTYFLIVWDLCEFARHADIWWNVRGSGAGSVAAYCLGITNIDPLSNSLLFERFLNPGRVTMPDIDLDYPEDRRAEMIQYCAHKYGEDKVAAIITFGTMGSKAAIRDVGRALDMPLPEVDRIARLIPSGAKPVKFEDALGDDPEKALPDLKTAYNQDQYARQIIDTARQLEGVTRHASTHAAGIIVGDRPLIEYIPLHRPTSGGSDEDVPVKMVTQFPMETCESIGLLKVDFLGLSTLTIMRKACELIEYYHGIRYDLSNIPYRPDPDDPEVTRMIEETFEMLSRGETVGVFQLESQGMRRMLTDMRPQRFEHIVAGISLYRPGPMDYIPTYNKRLHGEEEVKYLHPLLQDILSETYGITVYQEQIMQIGAKLFGYSLGEADLMRRAVSKKKKEDLQKHRETFVKRGPEHGVDPDTANLIFDDIEFFARYGFNKCVVAETEIVDAQTGRLVRIGDLASGAATIEHTLSCDTDHLRLVPGAVTAVMENGIKPVYRLTTQLGRQIEATANHPFYTFDGWRLLGDLHPGDQIACRALHPQNHENMVGASRWLAQGDPAGRPYENGPMTTTVTLAENDIQWDKVVSIEYTGDKPTYDLTIADTHNFVANDFIVHNSHAADYAVLTCQTAFLKCHYPHEYMAALMSVQRDDASKVSLFAADCSRMGIDVLPPDVNASMLDFTIEPKDDGSRAIRFGLAAVKNVGVGPLEHIIQQREDGGPFRDLDDFCRRADLRIVQKRALESLIRVGALDQFAARPTLLAALDRMHSFSADHHKAKEVGQISLFGEATGVDFGAEESILSHLPRIETVSKREMLRWEKELVGLYVTDHPLKMVMNDLQHIITHTSSELVELGEAANGKQVTVAGLVTEIRSLITKKGDAMAILTIEDITGTLNAVMFPRTWNENRDKVQEDSLLVVYGKADTSRGDIQIIVDSATQDFQVVTPAEELNHLEEMRFPWLDDDPVSGGENSDDEEIPAEPVIAAKPKPSRESSMVTDREIPGWLEAELDNGWSPPTEYAYQDDTGHIVGIEQPDTATDAAGRLKPPPAPPMRDHLQEPDEQPVIPRKPRRPRLAPEPEPEPIPSRMLILTIQRTGDAERDQRKMKHLHNIVTEYPGHDRFCFIFEGGGKKKARMDFPNVTIGINDAVLERACDLLGQENVWIEE